MELWNKLKDYKSILNESLSNIEPILLVLFTVTCCYLWFTFKSWLNSDVNETFWSLFTRKMRIIIFRTPFLGSFIKKKVDTIISDMSKNLNSVYHEIDFVNELPQKGLQVKQILQKMKEYESLGKLKWREGYVSGAIYSDQNNLDFLKLMQEVTAKNLYTNVLHLDVFPDIRKMEAEVVRMSCNLFKGGSEACGVMTTGGTESIILAIKAYRNFAIWERNISQPEIIAPVTAHVAFNKAAELLKVKLVSIPTDPITKKVNLKKMRKAINSSTCCLVGSAPAFPYGVMDPIEEITKLGLKYNIPVHIDCCLGGFIVPFVELAGFKLQHQCDFSILGLTSISADIHKYGYAPKGTSVLMYSHKKYLHHQYFISTDWPGGVYGSATLLGSRMGGVIAAAWASFMYHGLEGYIKNTRTILQNSNYLHDELAKLKGISICGSPSLSVIALFSDQIDILQVSDDLAIKGWNLNVLQFPPAIHICVTLMHTKEVVEKFIADIKEVVKNNLNLDYKPNQKGKAALYGMAQKIPDRSMIKVLTTHFLDCHYYTH